MDKDRQIGEMAKTICDICRPKTDCKTGTICIMAYIEAEALYEKGYRKQSEGEWEKADEFTEQYGYLYKCSVCGVLCWHGNYCPNCGAKMKGEANEQKRTSKV